MAESTLSLTFAQMYANIGAKLYGNRSPTGADLTECKRIVNEGYTFFAAYHDWSFLHPETTISIYPNVSGTVDGSGVYGAPSTTITATAAVFYAALVGESIKFTTSGTSYVISAYTSTKIIVVTGNASGEAANDTFTITRDGNYTLPDDFAEPESKFAFGPDTGYPALEWTTPDVIRARRAANASGAIPRLCSLQSVALTAATGQRWELMIWPTPSTLATLYYQYLRNPAALSADADYPVGGMRYSSAVMACAYMIWEGEQGRTDGPEAVKAMRLLAAARLTDLRQQPRNLGYNRDCSDGQTRRAGDMMNWQNGLDIH